MRQETPQELIVKCVFKKMDKGEKITQQHKDMLWNSLNWIIDNEKDKETLVWAYNIRGNIYAGRYW